MPGFIRNDWDRYLSGGTFQYNFAYKSEVPIAAIEPVPTSTPALALAHALAPNASTNTRKSNKNRVVISIQKSGKRKSRRHTKKNRYTRRK